MRRLEARLLGRILSLFALILAVVALTAVLSQAARLTDEIVERGLGLGQFSLLLLSLSPKMLELVTPFAFGLACIIACLQRFESRETLALRAAGGSVGRDTTVVASLGLVIALFLLAFSSFVVPQAQSLYRQTLTQTAQNAIQNFALPLGQPIDLGQGLSLEVQGQSAPGRFSGIRAIQIEGSDIITRLEAKSARLDRQDDVTALLTLIDVQGTRFQGTEIDQLSFGQTTLALNLPAARASAAKARADAQTTTELLRQTKDPAAREETLRRLSAALWVFALSVLTALALLGAQQNSQAQLRWSLGLFLLVIFLSIGQSATLSAGGFTSLHGGIVLALASTPIMFAVIIRIGRWARAQRSF